jgi:hypothetical protein
LHIATFGRTIIYIEWGRQGTQAVWNGEPFGERSLGNMRRRITLRWILARIRSKCN